MKTTQKRLKTFSDGSILIEKSVSGAKSENYAEVERILYYQEFEEPVIEEQEQGQTIDEEIPDFSDLKMDYDFEDEDFEVDNEKIYSPEDFHIEDEQTEDDTDNEGSEDLVLVRVDDKKIDVKDPLILPESCTFKMLVSLEPIGDWYTQEYQCDVYCQESGFQSQVIAETAENAVKDAIKIIVDLKRAKHDWVKNILLPYDKRAGFSNNLKKFSDFKKYTIQRFFMLDSETPFGYIKNKPETYSRQYQKLLKFFDTYFEVRHNQRFIKKSRGRLELIEDVSSIYDVVWTPEVLEERERLGKNKFFDVKRS